MENLDSLRVTKLKCLSCGSRDKRVVVRRDANNRKISFSTICCNCGEVRNYIFRDYDSKRDTKHSIITDIDVLKHLSDSENISEVFCAIPGEFCSNTKCPLHKYRPEKDLTYDDICHCEERCRTCQVRKVTVTKRPKFK